MPNENSTVPIDTCALAPETSIIIGKETNAVPTLVCNCKVTSGTIVP